MNKLYPTKTAKNRQTLEQLIKIHLQYCRQNNAIIEQLKHCDKELEQIIHAQRCSNPISMFEKRWKQQLKLQNDLLNASGSMLMPHIQVGNSSNYQHNPKRGTNVPLIEVLDATLDCLGTSDPQLNEIAHLIEFKR